ncbi:unnamed protein product [Mytilus edulis]|uniref:PiggyBac transposable element-derived protein domain-containing protein n=1 Tax=Mytilus edulis TaxID=6550 RepID=A0A8S3UHY6_MYTED|nr:unnamed protein product [Mytilus edulis]
MVSVNPWMRAFPPEPEQNTIFRANPGPRNMPAANSTPVKYFYLLFSIELIKEIVRRTNSYARNFIRKGAAKRYARMKSWRPLTKNELKSFLAIVFNMGLIRKSSIEEYWNSSLPRTLRKNRPMPNTIRNANPTPDNPVYMRKGKMLCAAFRDMDGKNQYAEC